MTETSEAPQAPRILSAIDPAMANTGIAIFTPGDTEISTALIHPRIEGEKKSFQQVYIASRDVVAQVGGLFRNLVVNMGAKIEMIMETPPPDAKGKVSWSPGLFLVDSLMLSRLNRLGIDPYLATPTRINELLTSDELPEDPSLQRKTKFSKGERRVWLYQILEINGLTVKEKKNAKGRTLKLSFDETDACVLLLYYMHNFNHPLVLPEPLSLERWTWKETACGL